VDTFLNTIPRNEDGDLDYKAMLDVIIGKGDCVTAVSLGLDPTSTVAMHLHSQQLIHCLHGSSDYSDCSDLAECLLKRNCYALLQVPLLLP
jgi:hypothetical protein